MRQETQCKTAEIRGRIRMQKLKKIGGIAIVLLIVAGGFMIYHYFQTWPLRFRSDLNAFFGSGNWEQVSSETKESMIYTVYHSSSDGLRSGERAGKFHEWNLVFRNRYGEEELWTISDHTMKINHSDHMFLSSERYSAREALTLELMDLSLYAVGDQVKRELLAEILTEQELECLNVYISYRDGNPPPKFYSRLRQEDWFTVNQLSAADYLETDLYDFYLEIQAYDYKVEKLSAEEQSHLMGSLGRIEGILRNAYGEYADYEIYLGEGYRAEFSGNRADAGMSF